MTHLERDLEALKLIRFEGNRLLAGAVGEIFATARTLYRDYQAGKLSRQDIASQRRVMEAQLREILHHPPVTGWPAECLAGRSPPGLQWQLNF